MDYSTSENGKSRLWKVVVPIDVSVLHEIPHRMMLTGFFPSEYGISIRIRMRLRYQGTEDRVVKQSGMSGNVLSRVDSATGERTGQPILEGTIHKPMRYSGYNRITRSA